MNKIFRIVTVDDTGSRTQDITEKSMQAAIKIAMDNLYTKNINSVRTVTCTTIQG